MKVKSEREVAQSCPTLSDPMDCSLPGSSVHGIFQARVLEWGAIASPNLPKVTYQALQPESPLFTLVLQESPIHPSNLNLNVTSSMELEEFSSG